MDQRQPVHLRRRRVEPAPVRTPGLLGPGRGAVDPGPAGCFRERRPPRSRPRPSGGHGAGPGRAVRAGAATLAAAGRTGSRGADDGGGPVAKSRWGSDAVGRWGRRRLGVRALVVGGLAVATLAVPLTAASAGAPVSVVGAVSLVPGPRLYRRGLRTAGQSENPVDRGQRGRSAGRVGGDRQSGQLDRPEPHTGIRFPFRGGTRRQPAGDEALLRPVHHRVDAAGLLLLVAASPRRAQLRPDARRDPHRRHRPAAPGQDPGRRALPHGDRVLGLPDGRPPQPDQRRRGEGAVERPPPARQLHRGRCPRWPLCSAS